MTVAVVFPLHTVQRPVQIFGHEHPVEALPAGWVQWFTTDRTQRSLTP